MYRFVKILCRCLSWLLISELLCLVLAFSFALLPQQWARWLSIVCVPAVHCLIMGNAGSGAAAAAIRHFRAEKQESAPLLPLLLALFCGIPRCLLYVLLRLFADSSLMLNLFLLFSAPFIPLHRLILNGAEPFSAVSAVRQLLTALPPLMTVLSVYIGYQLRYIPAIAAEKAKSLRA